MQFSLWPPLAAVGGGPFCPGRDLLLLLLIRYVPHHFDHLGSSFSLAYLSVDVTGALVFLPPKCMVFGHILCACVSVRRRDRCTCASPLHVLDAFIRVLCTPLSRVFSSLCGLLYLGQAHHALH